MYEDGRVAKLGADTRKAFRVKDYDLLWSGEVRRSPASRCSNLNAILGDSEIDVHTTLRPAKSINKMLASQYCNQRCRAFQKCFLVVVEADAEAVVHLRRNEDDIRHFCNHGLPRRFKQPQCP